MPAESTDGAGLLSGLVETAAATARGRIAEPFALVGCEGVEIQPTDGVTGIEAWCVRHDAATATIAAFVMARDAEGHEHIRGSGRFTFSASGDGANADHERPIK